MASLFVTGTDTGVGKTRIACALLRAFSAAGKTTAGMKPVAAGREDGRWQDVEALCSASTVKAPRHLVNSYAFEPAIAPHIAAELAGIHIEIDRIAAAHAQLSRLAEVVVVEGAGGFMIPLTATQTSADLAVRLKVPVVLVVGMRLGCLNHALLTRKAILAFGLTCAGWVANCIVPQMPHVDRNVATLEEHLDCPLLGRVPYQPEMTADETAKHLEVHSLLNV
jgi:dethiobiotin synthetase